MSKILYNRVYLRISTQCKLSDKKNYWTNNHVIYSSLVQQSLLNCINKKLVKLLKNLKKLKI